MNHLPRVLAEMRVCIVTVQLNNQCIFVSVRHSFMHKPCHMMFPTVLSSLLSVLNLKLDSVLFASASSETSQVRKLVSQLGMSSTPKTTLCATVAINEAIHNRCRCVSPDNPLMLSR